MNDMRCGKFSDETSRADSDQHMNVALLNQEIERFILAHPGPGQTADAPQDPEGREHRHWNLTSSLITHRTSSEIRRIILRNPYLTPGYWLRDDGEVVKTLLDPHGRQEHYEVVLKESLSSAAIAQIINALHKL